MIAFLLRRVLWLIPLLLGVSLITFLMIHLIPGDPVQIMMGESPTGVDLRLARHELGLDQPLPLQYVHYLGNLVHGNLGTSIRSQRPVLAEIGDRFPATLQLTLAAMSAAVVVGVGLGTLAAAVRSRVIRGVVLLLSTLGLSLPSFWLGLLLIYFFALHVRWFPVLSDTSLKGTVLPAVTLALPAAAVLSRVTFAGLAEVLQQDYIRTARAKGVTRLRIVLMHAMRNGVIVVVTIAGLQFGALLAGSVIVETVFSRPGLGSFVVSAIISRDYPDIQGVVLVFAVVYVAMNTLLDVLYAMINPLIRVS